MDLLTGIVLVAAVSLMLAPGAPLRDSWDRNRAKAAQEKAARRLWRTLTATASPLYSGTDPADVIEFSDYECPFCRQSQPSVDTSVVGGVRVALLHMPIASHPQARGAAVAALCAERHGRFAALHAQLMRTSAWRTDSNWVREARTAGISDTIAFIACLHSSDVAERLSRHLALVDSLRVTATPTFVGRVAAHHGVIDSPKLRALATVR